jgi:acetyl esterase/lipase
MKWTGVVAVAVFAACMAGAAKKSEALLQKDLTYASVDGKKLQYDMAKPAHGKGPFPLVICVHGGGWQLGDRKSFDKEICDLADHGYVGASITYRLAPDYRWPAQLDDVRNAVRFFRAHAVENGVDPKRIALMGDDSGGHLALMMGLLAAQEDKNVPMEKSSRVSAVVNFFGPTDLREWRVTSAWVETKIRIGFFKSSEQIIEDFLGTRDRTAPIYTEVSPISHVTSDAPPVLTIIGSKDPLVALEQPKAFHAALEKAGVPGDLLIVDGAEHNRDSTNQATDADGYSIKFLDKYLKKS